MKTKETNLKHLEVVGGGFRDVFGKPCKLISKERIRRELWKKGIYEQIEYPERFAQPAVSSEDIMALATANFDKNQRELLIKYAKDLEINNENRMP